MMTLVRSKSVPAGRVAESMANAENDRTEFPAVPPEPGSESGESTWLRELADSRSGRHSRASSIISTRTRFSTTTLDDARSIDIQAGGQSFHIGRFGDRITDTSAPPPYPGSLHDEPTHTHTHTHPLARGYPFVHPEPSLFADSVRGDLRYFGRYGRGGRGSRRHRRVRIAMPDHDGPLSANEDESPAATPSRVVTEEELRQIVRDLPDRLKRVLGIDASHFDADAASILSNEIPSTRSEADTAEGHTDESFNPDLSYEGNTYSSSGKLKTHPDLTPTKVPTHTDAAFLEPGETRVKSGIKTLENLQALYNVGNFSIDQGSSTQSSTKPAYDNDNDNNEDIPPSSASASLSTLHAPDATTPPTPFTEPTQFPLTVGDLNELSRLYNRVIRDLDREHRKQLHSRDKELDQLRILLHEKDIVYRQQLKGKDFVIEDLMKRIDHFEETMEAKVEKARNEVEDLWEMRWKEHDRQLMAKVGLMRVPSYSNLYSAARDGRSSETLRTNGNNNDDSDSDDDRKKDAESHGDGDAGKATKKLDNDETKDKTD